MDNTSGASNIGFRVGPCCRPHSREGSVGYFVCQVKTHILSGGQSNKQKNTEMHRQNPKVQKGSKPSTMQGVHWLKWKKGLGITGHVGTDILGTEQVTGETFEVITNGGKATNKSRKDAREQESSKSNTKH